MAFLRCRGNIKDVEKELGISYPTIRSRLEEALQTLGIQKRPEEAAPQKMNRKEYAQILSALERGEVSPQEALEAIQREK